MVSLVWQMLIVLFVFLLQQRLFSYDTEETYQEISNYLVYEVFSNDKATKRLDYLKRQLKNFRVENDELFHMNGNKKQRILFSAEERKNAIEEAHKRKGKYN